VPILAIGALGFAFAIMNSSFRINRAVAQEAGGEPAVEDFDRAPDAIHITGGVPGAASTSSTDSGADSSTPPMASSAAPAPMSAPAEPAPMVVPSPAVASEPPPSAIAPAASATLPSAEPTVSEVRIEPGTSSLPTPVAEPSVAASAPAGPPPDVMEGGASAAAASPAPAEAPPIPQAVAAVASPVAAPSVEAAAAPAAAQTPSESEWSPPPSRISAAAVPTAAAEIAQPAATPAAVASVPAKAASLPAIAPSGDSKQRESRSPRSSSDMARTRRAAPAKEPTEIASKEPDDGGGFAGLKFASGNQPIHITGDSMSVDSKRNSVVWSGHVRANQSGSQLTSDSLRLNYGQGFHDVKEMIASGNVRISQGTRWATGDNAVMDQTKHTVTLTGSPVVHDGEDQIAGTKITVHLDTNQSDVQNARAVIFPKQGKAESDGSNNPTQGDDLSTLLPSAHSEPPQTIEGAASEPANP
jgi:lipopolysaccharide transport protein LptA